MIIQDIYIPSGAPRVAIEVQRQPGEKALGHGAISISDPREERKSRLVYIDNWEKQPDQTSETATVYTCEMLKQSFIDKIRSEGVTAHLNINRRELIPDKKESSENPMGCRLPIEDFVSIEGDLHKLTRTELGQWYSSSLVAGMLRKAEDNKWKIIKPGTIKVEKSGGVSWEGKRGYAEAIIEWMLSNEYRSHKFYREKTTGEWAEIDSNSALSEDREGKLKIVGEKTK